MGDLKRNVGNEHSGTATVQRDLYGMMTGRWVAKEGDKRSECGFLTASYQTDLAPSGTARRDQDKASRFQEPRKDTVRKTSSKWPVRIAKRWASRARPGLLYPGQQ